MQCPLCGAKTRVENVITSRGRSNRQRICESQICGVVFQTIEVPIGPAKVVEAAKLPNLAVLAGGTEESVAERETAGGG